MAKPLHPNDPGYILEKIYGPGPLDTERIEGFKAWREPPLTAQEHTPLDDLRKMQDAVGRTSVKSEAERVDELLTVLRKHGVTDFRGCGIDVRIESQKPIPVRYEMSAQATKVRQWERPAATDTPQPYVPPHVDPSKPEPTQVVEPQHFHIEDALYGAGAE